MRTDTPTSKANPIAEADVPDVAKTARVIVLLPVETKVNVVQARDKVQAVAPDRDPVHGMPEGIIGVRSRSGAGPVRVVNLATSLSSNRLRCPT